MDEKITSAANELIAESSPYLLQHAYNPVNWKSWGNSAWETAQKEDKLVLISIGYSACHWCHVMEHESFEDPEIAEIMNHHFINIKVDREERPDVDHIYMEAVQLMNNGQGGWPLNCFTLPDGRPIYGGTYFPKNAWKKLLLYLADFWTDKRNEALTFAQNVTAAIREYGEVETLFSAHRPFSEENLARVVIPWSQYFDRQWGGTERVPKFPLPANWAFLMSYAHLSGQEDVSRAVQITLSRMALGGIFDQLGGGFARYSTDRFWLVPHFEKMLYDNAQLVTLYSDAYLKYDREPLYGKTIDQTLQFVFRELTHPSGAFYSALDADSEGVEGKFYCWTDAELNKHLPEPEYLLFREYYGCTEAGNFEHGMNILHRNHPKQPELTVDNVKRLIDASMKLLKIREVRVRPGLDDKIITAWNGMMIKACVRAYRVFGNEEYLLAAQKAMQFFLTRMTDEYRLYRIFAKEKRSVNGYLDDYAFLIAALIELYQATFNENYLTEAENYLLYALDHFFDERVQMFFYTSDLDPPLIARKKEIADNVIPSSNSEMAHHLLTLSKILKKDRYKAIALQMLQNVAPETESYGSSHAHWAALMARMVYPEYEISFTGANAQELRKQWDANSYYPFTIVTGTDTSESRLPVLKDKTGTENRIFICKDETCLAPVKDVKTAYEELLKDFSLSLKRS